MSERDLAAIVRHVLLSLDPPESEGMRDLRTDALNALAALEQQAADAQEVSEARLDVIRVAEAALAEARALASAYHKTLKTSVSALAEARAEQTAGLEDVRMEAIAEAVMAAFPDSDPDGYDADDLIKRNVEQVANLRDELTARAVRAEEALRQAQNDIASVAQAGFDSTRHDVAVAAMYRIDKTLAAAGADTEPDA